VLAFDVGTTFSGVSYCLLDPGLVPEIKGVTRYPAQERVGGDSKIPSILYYDQDGNVRAVGAEALRGSVTEQAEDEDWIKVEWFKLHLRPRALESTHITDRDIPPLPGNVTPLRAFADFLRYLFRCARTYIQDTHTCGEDLWKSVEKHLEFVLSHPNGWEGPQQSQMRQAAILAGLIPDNSEGHSRIRFVTEGEASLHFCVRNGLVTDAMKTGQGIVIVDAGGGTVDSCAYFMTLSSASFEEIAPAECRLQGSVFVSRRARTYLEEKLYKSKFNSDVALMTDCFDKTTKLSFRNEEEPSYIKFGTARDRDLSVGIRSGQMRLPGTDVAELFEPSVKAIVEAIEKQRQAAAKPISTICLVGGFAASDWLFARLQMHIQDLGLGFCRPDSHVNKAVADGAVSFYLDHVVSSRMARFTYGISILVSYDSSRAEHRRRCHTAVTLPSGRICIPDAFSTILSKGTKVSEETEFQQPYQRERLNVSELDTISSEIICYRGNQTHPQWVDVEPSMFSTLCIISANTTQMARSLKSRAGKGGVRYYLLEYKIVLLFGLTELKAQISWMENGVEKRGPASIVYERL